MTAVVEARGLVKTYGEITAVDHVDLTVEQGDVYGYLGPNGAGKTTSLRMLLGLIRPSSGSAKLFGRDPMIDGVRALEGVAGFVEAPRFYPYLSGRKNLELVAALDSGDARSQIDAALDTVDLTDRAKDKVGGYSHGMRQRLGIAGALIRRPQLLLLDEPATGLDPAGMRDMRALIRSLADSGITVLLSSHLMNEVEELCNRVAIIRAGRIVYEGGLDELRASAAGSYTLRTSDDELAAQICAIHDGPARLHRHARRPAHARGRGRDRGAQPRARALGRRTALARAGRRLARGALLRAHRGCATGTRRRARARAGGVMPHTATVYRWELRKLVAQKRTYLGLAAATIAPSIFVAALALQSGAPGDVPFGSYVRDTGLAAPLVLLTFGSIWLFPLIASLVAGDIVAAEDGNGTLKTILTRSVTRGQLFAAKVGAAVTYALLALLAMAVVSLTEATIAWGFNPITSLSGTTVSAGEGLALVFASMGVYALPLLAITAIGVLLSTVTRNSAGAVVGALMIALLMQLIGILPGIEAIEPYLLTTQFDAWHGFLRTPIDWEPIIRGGWVSAVYAAVALASAYVVFLRRDVAGGYF